MTREFKLQDPGEGIHEAEVRELQVSAGDHVNDGDPLLSVETDKAINDITAPFTGTVKTLKVEVGQQIKVGDVLLTYDSDDESASEASADVTSESQERAGGEDASKKKVKEDKKKGEEKEGEKETQPSGKGKKGSSVSQDKSSPKSHPQESERQEKAKSDDSVDKEQESRKAAGRPVPASPATRRRAREQGVDLHQVEGSGPGGRITTEDLQAYAARGEAGGGKERAELPDFSRWGDIERKPLRSLRRATARQMSLSWSKIPHVMHQETADITELELFRRQHRQAVADQGGKLTLTVLVMKAVTAALREYPGFNTSLDEDKDEIIVRNYHHIGVAVDTDSGLLVPVIRDVDRKSITELAVELTSLAEHARQGEIEQHEMQGGCFTLTNPGPLGGDSFTPIINYPEAAILGVCSARLQPVVSGDMDNWEISPRLHLPLCLVFDHRLNDGAEAARFLHNIVATLRDPQAYLLAV